MRRTMMTVLVAMMTVAGLVATTAGPADAGTRHRHGKHHVGYTRVVVAPPVYELVAGAGITPAPLDGAKAAPYKGTLAAKFPITGYTLRELRIKHSGGISLTAGTATIELRNFYIDLIRGFVSAKVKGTIGDVGRVDLFRIAVSDRPDLGVVRLKLTPTAAGALNTTFGVSAFAAGGTFGYATPKPLSRF
jgi:hypothetical protein